MEHPWKKWIPGVLCNEQLKELCKGIIRGTVPSFKPSPSSMDLHLGDEGYQMVNGSVKPLVKITWEKLKDRN